MMRYGDVVRAVMITLISGIAIATPSFAEAQVGTGPRPPREPARRPSQAPPAPYQPPPAPYQLPIVGRVPNIGWLPLFAPIERLGTNCVTWGDRTSMQAIGVSRGWQVFGAGYRHSFIGLDARGRVRYLMDSMQELYGPYRDREEATIYFFTNGKVEIGRRGAWNISGDAGNTWPQVSGLFASDTVRAYHYALSLVRLCAG